jgi:hypothetical protein
MAIEFQWVQVQICFAGGQMGGLQLGPQAASGPCACTRDGNTIPSAAKKRQPADSFFMDPAPISATEVSGGSTQFAE